MAQRFNALDSLRGIAAIAVAVFHFIPDWAGYLAVDFFLVLSGFVLTHRYFYCEQSLNYTEFIMHRLARLYPLHIVMLLIFIAVFYFLNQSFPDYPDGGLFTFAQHLVLMQNIGLNPSGLTYNLPSWSISVEFWINLFVIYFFSKDSRLWKVVCLILICLFVIYVNTNHLDTHAANYYTYVNSGLLRGMASFCIGYCTYRLFVVFCTKRLSFLTYNLMELISLFVTLIVIYYREDKLSQIDFLSPFVFALLILSFSLEKGLLSSRLVKLRYLGNISYSIYLIHFIVLIVLLHYEQIIGVSTPALLSLYLLLVVALSHFCHAYIEKPLNKKLKKELTYRVRGFNSPLK